MSTVFFGDSVLKLKVRGVRRTSSILLLRLNTELMYIAFVYEKARRKLNTVMGSQIPKRLCMDMALYSVLQNVYTSKVLHQTMHCLTMQLR